MSEPDRVIELVHETDHVGTGLALLTEQFKGLPIIRDILTTWLAQAQDIEDSFWDVLSVQLADATGDALDQYGEFLGYPQGSLSDADYRIVLGALAIAIRSSGTVPDLVDVIEAVRGAVAVTLAEYQVATVKVEPAAALALGSALLLEVLRRAKLGGVRLLVVDVPAGDTFAFSATRRTVIDTARGLSDATAATGGHLVGILEA